MSDNNLNINNHVNNNKIIRKDNLIISNLVNNFIISNLVNNISNNNLIINNHVNNNLIINNQVNNKINMPIILKHVINT